MKLSAILIFLILKAPLLFAVYNVTSNSDDGSIGTLRYGLNTDPGDSIDLSLISGQTITLLSNLPTIPATANMQITNGNASPVIIDGTTSNFLIFGIDISPNMTVNLGQIIATTNPVSDPGTFMLSGGTISISNTNTTISNTTGMTVLETVQLDLTGTSGTQTLGDLSGDLNSILIDISAYTVGTNQSTSPQFDGSIQGGSSMTKANSNTFIAGPDSTLNTNPIINGGIFVMNGAFGAGNPSSITVNSGGILSGVGKNGDLSTQLSAITVNSGGSFSPTPTSSGTLVQVSSLVLHSGGIFNVEFSGTNYGQVQLASSLDLTSGPVLKVSVDNGTSLKAGNSYTIATAPSITGSFSNFNYPSGYSFNVAYPGDTSILLTVALVPAPQITLISAAAGTSTAATANYINSLTAPQAVIDQVEVISQLPPALQTAAVATINPVRNQYIAFTQNRSQILATAAIHQRKKTTNKKKKVRAETKLLSQNDDRPFQEGSLMADTNEIGTPTKKKQSPSPVKNNCLWGELYGQWSHQDEQLGDPAFSITSKGLFTGYDYNGWNMWDLTVSGGYIRTITKSAQDLGGQKQNSVFGSAQATANISDFSIELGFSGGWHNTFNSCHIFYPGYDAHAISKYPGFQFDAHLGLTYGFDFTNYSFEPFANFDFAYTYDSGFQETGADPWNMIQSASVSLLLASEVGLTAEQFKTRNGCQLILTEALSYINMKPFQRGLTEAIVGAGSSFMVNTLTSTQNLVHPSGEVEFITSNSLYFSALYDGLFGSGYSSNTLTLRFAADF